MQKVNEKLLVMKETPNSTRFFDFKLFKSLKKWRFEVENYYEQIWPEVIEHKFGQNFYGKREFLNSFKMEKNFVFVLKMSKSVKSFRLEVQQNQCVFLTNLMRRLPDNNPQFSAKKAFLTLELFQTDGVVEVSSELNLKLESHLSFESDSNQPNVFEFQKGDIQGLQREMNFYLLCLFKKLNSRKPTVLDLKVEYHSENEALGKRSFNWQYEICSPILSRIST